MRVVSCGRLVNDGALPREFRNYSGHKRSSSVSPNVSRGSMLECDLLQKKLDDVISWGSGQCLCLSIVGVMVDGHNNLVVIGGLHSEWSMFNPTGQNAAGVSWTGCRRPAG